MLPELHQLEALVTLQQTGSVTRTATALHIAQPAISRKLQSLESRVGPLFDRSKHKVKLTARGTAIANEASRLIESLGVILTSRFVS
jgi:DNA-binding transcriptional LysR family regulator